MEWREQSTVSCDEAYLEAQRWIEAVTKKKFGSSDFRSALENGVLLCELISNVKPGTIRRVNRLPTPIAGLDNLNVFLRACGKLGLKEAQLFHPGDLQDLSTRVTVKAEETNRRLKNVLITIYWLGRRAQCDPVYNGPYLNLKAFEGLLGTALYKALQDSSHSRDSSILRDSGFGDSWYSEQEELHHFQSGAGGHRRDDSLDSLDSLGSRPHSISSDIKGSSEGFFSDTEPESVFRMADKDNLSYRRSAVLTPRTTTQFNQFLPSKDKASGYVPAPLRKKRAERNEDNRRSLTSPYEEEDIPLTRSKSTSDIDMDQSAARQMRYEELQKYRQQIKQSDDKWQDDLSKWKHRRKSVNSDIVKKKEEREKIEEITYGSNRKSKTFKEMQEDRESRRQSLGSRLGSLSYLDDEDLFSKSASTPRAPYSRSQTIDNPYSSYSSSFSTRPEPVVTQEEPPVASPATGRASSPTPSKETVDSSTDRETTITSTITSSRYRSYQRSPSPPAEQLSGRQTSSVETVKTTTATSSLNFEPRVQEPKSPLLVPQTEVPSVDSQFKQSQQPIPMEPKPPVVSRVSASLPRTYQRLDSARLTSVVAPRPFPGSQATRLSSLPRAYTTDDSHKPVNGDLDNSKKLSVPSRYHQFMTSEDEAQSSSAHSSEDEDDQEESVEEVITEGKSPAPVEITTETTVISAPVKDSSQESFCEMRISLNQKPNSSRDFGFQSAWDSTGARVTSIVPGSSAEMCQLQPGDEVVSVNGHQVAGMSYTSWKSHMEEALQEGSLVMDIRRHGKNSAPESKIFNSSLDLTSHTSTKPEPVKDAITRPIIDVASNGLNGNLRDEPVTMRNKESEPISLKNLKRRSEFFEQGGTEPIMPDIPVPSIAPSSSRWSWDPEEERRRQEKWQKEQERLLQEKYKRDQEKLQEEWLKSQEEITSTQQKPTNLEVNDQSAGPHSPLSPVSQPLSSLWEEQERRRKEELEQRRQAEERELQRLREERQRREEEEERKRRAEEEEGKRRQIEEEEKERQRRREEEEERERRRREEEEQRRRAEETAEQQRRERERALEIQRQQQQCRVRSKSSPQLDDEERPQPRVMGSTVAQRGQQSQAELERQQLLKEMKKKTPLLTDSSWIRQRSATTSTGSSRESETPHMRRGESLDNLDTNNYNSWRSSWTPRTNSQIPNYSRPQSALSGSTSSYGGWSGALPRSSTLPSSSSMGSLRGGAGTPSAPWSRQTPSPSLSSPSPTRSPEPLPDSQQRGRSVSGKKICTYCDTPLGKGAAMIIESLGLCYHLGCFKCFDCGSDLGGSEAGAEVRIRNKHLYCNTCYMRFKTGQPTPM